MLTSSLTWGELGWAVLLGIALVLLGNLAGSWLAGLANRSLDRARLDPSVRRLVVGLVRPTIVVIAVVAALHQAGFNLSGAVAVLGAATLAIGLALQNSLSNVASGAILLTLRPFRDGESIETSGERGVVQSLGLFTTEILTHTGETVTLPNDLIIKGPIKNFSRAGTRRVDIVVTVAFDTDVDTALAALAPVTEHELALPDPGPWVGIEQTSPRGLRLGVRVWVKASDFLKVRSDLSRGVVEALRNAGVGLPTAMAELG